MYLLFKDQSSNCPTVDGPGSGLPCIFPFKFRGTVYNNTCSPPVRNTNNKSWCSTRVDASGNHIRGNWGNCDENCMSLNGNSPVQVVVSRHLIFFLRWLLMRCLLLRNLLTFSTKRSLMSSCLES